MIKKIIKKTANVIGLEIHRLNPAADNTSQLLAAMKHVNTNLIFDVGANVGQFSSEIRGRGFTGKIICFEPLTDAREKLIQLTKDDPSWIVHERVAVGEKNGVLEINISGNSVSSSLLPMLDSHSGAAPDSIYVGCEKVPVISLDSILGRYLCEDSNLFLKIDTQGYEWQVLNGATETLRIAKGVLCELSLAPLYRGQRLWQEMIARLEDEGFTLWALQKGFTDPRDGRTLQVDAIFIRV